jgi:hypothetical protein
MLSSNGLQLIGMPQVAFVSVVLGLAAWPLLWFVEQCVRQR